jgi:hypothetical protein
MTGTVEAMEPDKSPGVWTGSDEELAALALAADPHEDLTADAVAFVDPGADFGLPDWYMPAAQTPPRSGRKRGLRLVIAVSLLAINAAGLCVTYGQLVIA